MAYDAQWAGRQFTIVDTGGWAPDARDRAAAIAAQAEIAAGTADVILFVVDATVGALDEDEAAVRMLRRTRKPVILVANKVDNSAQELESAVLWSLGLGQPYPVELNAWRRDAVERLPAPEAQSLPEIARHLARRTGLPGLLGQVLTLVEVDRGVARVDQVAGVPGDQGVAQFAA